MRAAKHMHRHFLSFRSGASIYLGRHLAWMEMLKAVSTIFWCYEVELEDKEKEWTIEGGFIKAQKGINVVLRDRVLEKDTE